MQILNVLVGSVGVATAIAALLTGSDLVWRVSQVRFLLSSGVLMIIAILLAVPHVMLERSGEVV